MGLMLLVWGAVGGSGFQSVARADATGAVNQCNGTSNADAQLVRCTVTVTNNLNIASEKTSSKVTIKACSGAPGADPTCKTTTTSYTPLQKSVTQCNGSGNAGGSTVECTVNIVNNITGKATTSPATVNQCNDSGTGGGTQPTVVCDPTGNTTNATVTQCNEAGNGGGGVRRVRCDVTTSTQTSALPVKVNQCVGSGNGGGATVVCTVSITNHVLEATPSSSSPASSSPASSTPASSSPAGSTSSHSTAPSSTSSHSTTPSSTSSVHHSTGVSPSAGVEATVVTAAPTSAESTRVAAVNAARSSSSFIAPAGLTGDTPTHRGANFLLLGMGLTFMAAGLLAIVRRSAR